MDDLTCTIQRSPVRANRAYGRDSVLSAFLKQCREGLHHPDFNVKDLDEKV